MALPAPTVSSKLWGTMFSLSSNQHSDFRGNRWPFLSQHKIREKKRKRFVSCPCNIYQRINTREDSDVKTATDQPAASVSPAPPRRLTGASTSRPTRDENPAAHVQVARSRRAGPSIARWPGRIALPETAFLTAPTTRSGPGKVACQPELTLDLESNGRFRLVLTIFKGC